MADFARLGALTAELDPPYAAADLVRRAAGTPIRVAAKSVRCRALIDEALATDGFHGVMSYALPEAIWLARGGVDDLLMGYPTVHRAALRELAADPGLASRITLMVDDPAQLAIAKDAAGAGAARLQVCLDVDASLRVLGQHLGVRRSPLRTPDRVVDDRARQRDDLVRGADRRAAGHLARGALGEAALRRRARRAALAGRRRGQAGRADHAGQRRRQRQHRDQQRRPVGHRGHRG